MRATDALMEEHRVIELVLDCLEKLADRCAAGQGLDGASAREAIEFLRHFADGCHHGKEEGLLFPLLEARGLPPRGPTSVMRYEHEQGRHLIAALDAAVSQPDAEAFVRAARGYVRLLRDHILKEDHCLFPMAAQALSEADAQALWRSFERVESVEGTERTHESYLRLANDLADRLGVPREKAAACGSGCCHHH